MNISKHYKSLLYILPLCLAGVLGPSAQAAKNALNCTVVDESGNPVPKTQVMLTSSKGKQSKKKTNDQGQVKFTGLDDGKYMIGVENAVPGTYEVSGNTEQACKYTIVNAASANAKLQEVMQLVQQKKFAEAEDKGKKLVELMPGEGAAHYVLAVAYAYEGNEKANEEVKKAADLSPDKFKDKVLPIQMQALNQQAESAKQKADFAEAIKKYQAMQAMAPNDPTVYYNMAVTYAAAKNYDEALKNIDKELALKPDDAEAKQRRALWEKQFEEQLNKPLGK